MKVEKIHFIMVVENMNRAVQFYKDVFSLNIASQSEWWSELEFGNAIIALHGGGTGAPKSSDLSIQVDSLESACKIIKENGGSLISEPEKRTGEPIMLALVGDTEGNTFSLTQWVGY